MEGLTILTVFLVLSVSDGQGGSWASCTVLCLGSDPCVGSRCNYPGAHCVTNYCGGCRPLWLHGERWLTTEECTAPAPLNKCLDRLSNCADYARSVPNVCSPLYASWARINCPRYCGYCTCNAFK